MRYLPAQGMLSWLMHRRDTTPASRLRGALLATWVIACAVALPIATRAAHWTGRIDAPAPDASRPTDATLTDTDAEAQAWLPVVFAVTPGERPVAVRARASITGEALRAECVGATGWRGQAIALVRVAPPAAGGRIEIDLDTAPGAEPPVRSLRQEPDTARRTRDLLRATIANPEAILGPPAADAAPRRRFLPAGDPSLDGSGVRYLVITTEALRSTFEPLVEWKIRRGVPTAIRTLEWIMSRTRQGQDPAETLRYFLREAYTLWGIEYVLLGGDTDIIPVRYAWSSIYGGTTSPTDYYYACLDGTWNADGDAVWGEGALGFASSEAELFPELTIGRAPVNNAQEAQIFVDRVIGYESPVYFDYQDRATFLAEILIPANWDSGMAYSYNGAVGTEQMVQSLPPAMTVQRLYDTHWLYSGATKLTKSGAIAAMNNGVGIVNQLGHGFRYTMSCGDASMVNSDADALSNGDRSFVLVMANCAAASFDYNCLAERFLLNPGGGAAGVIGATRSVSAGLIVTYNRSIHEEIFQNGSVHLGQALDAARIERAALADLDGSDRWIQLCLTTLGDPEMMVWTDAVRPVELVHAGQVPIATGTLEVEVLSAAAPVEGARVCAYKANEVFAAAFTDAAGRVALPVEPETAGELYLTVSGQNLASSTDTLLVPPAAGPVLTLAAHAIDDDASGASDGDGNGSLDAGETIEITIDIGNLGAAPADSVVAFATSPDPRFTVLQGTIAIGEVSASGETSGTGALVVHVVPEVPDGTAMDLALDLVDGLGQHFAETLRLQVCAPRPEPVRVELADTGTSTTIAIELKNFGSGRLLSLQATIVDPSPELTFLSESTRFPVIAALATEAASPLLEFVDASPGTLEPIVLRFEDDRGRSFLQRIDRQPPAAPAAPVADLTAGAGTVHLTWTVSPAADHLGYHVFRRLHGDGEFARRTPDAIRHADYFDTDVLTSTQYDYYVVDVDSSLQWSGGSAIRVVSTTAAALEGWPGELLDPASGSVAIGDLDGDGRPEVVVGDRGIYAWTADGVEVRDGDNDPTTLGVFDPLPGTLTASIALASIDASPGLEIVTASWATNRIDVKNGNGMSLPGWPQVPANGGNTGYWASPAVADLDGDGSVEIVAISKDGWLYAWHADGSPLLPATNGGVRQVGIWTQTTPALADLDGDGHREIIVSGSLAQLFVLRDDGSDFPGWPVSFFAFGKSSPAVGDVDADGDLEIVVSSESDHLYVFQSDGTFLPGWPRLVPSDAPDLGPSPALGDLDGNGTLEIVICSVKSPFPNTKIFVFDAAGNTLLTKPLELNSQSSPILADIDGDGGTDIVHGGEAGSLHAWNLSGQELPGFPIALGDFVRGTPAYCDLDGDGGGDLVLAGWDQQVYAWRLPGPYRPDRAPWPTFHGNMARTGLLEREFPTPVGETPLPRRLAAVWAPNPFNPSVTLRFEVPERTAASAGSALQHVIVAVYDPRGRLMRTLLDAPRPAGTYRLVWDGKDNAGRALGSGVYLYRVAAGPETVAGKITLLR